MTYPDHISVFHKLREMPSPDSSSFLLDVMVLSEAKQRAAARCEEDIVTYDYKMGKKINCTPWMIDGFRQVWREQENEKRRVVERIQEIEKAITRLEKESWDREGAVEDIGGA